MGILKRVFKIPPLPLYKCCEPITLLDASFAHYSSTLFRGGRGEKHKIVQIAVFPIIFVTDCSYLFNVGLRHAHSVLFPSDRNETKVLSYPF